MNAPVLNFSFQFETICCHKCNAAYALNAEFVERKREQGGSWNCPYCDQSTIFTTTEVAKLKKQLEQANKDRDWYKQRQADERAAREKTERRLTAQRGVTKRIKNRVAHGVCPCCTRSFENLRRHMDTKHPGYVAEKVTA